ncbi:MAG: hypothetical protein K2O06_03170 [Acetatifactor sp.]|nr:hypothetical protein [Acetatifactor sp.]
MTDRIRMGLELMKYGYNRGLYTVLEIFMVLLGLGYFIAGVPSVGAFFLMGSMTCQLQLLSSVSVCLMVRTSPRRRQLETWVFPAVNMIKSVLLYLLILGLRLIGGIWMRESLQTLPEEMIFMGLAAFIVMVFLGMAYKFMVLATIFFGLLFYAGFRLPELMAGTLSQLSPAAGIGIGLLEIVLGALVQAGMIRLLYGLPPSKLSQDRGLRRYL